MPETLAFIRAKAKQYKVPVSKNTIEDVRRSIEQRILYENSKPQNYKRIHMNGSITEMCLAKVDLVLRGDQAKQEFAARHMPKIVPDRFLNNDGSGNERSIGYDSGAFGSYCSLVEQLYQLDRDLFKRIIDGYPKLKAAFDFWPDVWCIEKYVPLIGDAGEPGDTSGLHGTPGAYLALFDVTGDPRYAQVAMRMVEGDSAKLPRHIYAKDPEGLIARAVEANTKAGKWQSPSTVKRDYKLGILRSDSKSNPIAAWLFYSPQGGTSSHSHFDALNFGLYTFGLSIVCEQGYPQFTGGWPARWDWTSNTRSHSTVTVDDNGQRHCDGGKLLAFAEADGARMISAEAPWAYAQVSLYRRTLLLIDAPNDHHFIVDVFRVQGGRKHAYTVPLFYGDLTARGLTLAPHPDIYGHYIEQAQSAPASSAWSVDAAIRSGWDKDVTAHLRIHGSADAANVILGKGETRYGKDVPRRLSYLLISRDDNDSSLASTFIVLYEPYRTQPFIQSVDIGRSSDLTDAVVEVTTTEPKASYRIAISDRNPDNVIATVIEQMFDRTSKLTLQGVPK
jgi:hypothetical protein